MDLGFAETRYEEVSTQLKDALSELQHFKEANVDHPEKAPRSSVVRAGLFFSVQFVVLIFKHLNWDTCLQVGPGDSLA